MSLAALKRRLTVGTKVTMLSHDWYPNCALNGVERTVELTQSNAIGIGDGEKISWLYFDKASDFKYDGGNTFIAYLNKAENEKMIYEIS